MNIHRETQDLDGKRKKTMQDSYSADLAKLTK